MPQYFEAPEDQEKRKEREKDRPRKMCDDIREDLLACTYESSCVRDVCVVLVFTCQVLCKLIKKIL